MAAAFFSLGEGPASAAMVEEDYLAPGDGLLTLDTDTGHQWLDLTQTKNNSFDTMTAMLEPGGTFELFRRATAAEVSTLFSNFGVVISSFSTNNVEPVFEMNELLGVIQIVNGGISNGGGRAGAAGFTSDAGGLGHLLSSYFLDDFSPPLTGYAAAPDGSGNDTFASASVGHFLIKIIPPEDIRVEYPLGISISQAVVIVVGTNAVNTTNTYSFRLGNEGELALSNLVLSKSGPHAAAFQIPTLPGTVAGLTTNTDFSIEVTAFSEGILTGQFQIASSDPDENPFTFTLEFASLSYTNDTDADGMNDAAEYLLRDLGFDWAAEQTGLVAVLDDNAAAANFYKSVGTCSPGTYSSNGAPPCLPAPPGYYVPTSGATGLIAASAGYFVSGYEATEQIEASPGTYAPIPGMHQALDAPLGYYVNSPTSTTPVAAQPGYFVSITAATTQQMVSAGFYTPASGMASGIPAPLGYYTTNGSSAPIPAPKGHYVDMAGSGSATPAAAGQYAPIQGMHSALDAPVGYYVNVETASVATAAEPGYVVSLTGSTTQQLVTAGYYAPMAGMAFALQAPLGYYTTNGSAAPIPAPVGHYVDSVGADKPTPAPVGKYAPIQGMHLALQAPVGYYVNIETSSVPVAAQPGYVVNLPGAITQQLVSAGYYAPLAAMAEGIPALPGYYTSSEGATSLTAALPGKYVAGYAQTEAIDAEAGTYTPVEGMSTGAPAPQGYYTLPGQQTLTPAPAGSYVSMVGATGATETVAGTYAPIPGMRQALDAPLGYYVPTNGQSVITPAPVGAFVSSTGAQIPEYVTAGRIAPIEGMQASILLGDLDGNDTVTQDELDAVVGNFWNDMGWIDISMFDVSEDGTLTFALTNALSSSLNTYGSTNLPGFTALGTAVPLYRFNDPDATNMPSKVYRLEMP